MNVTFTTDNDELNAKFVAEATAAGLQALKGHKVLGGMRASIYNAMPIEGVQAFKKAFDAEAGEVYEDNSALIEGLRQDIDELDKEANEVLQTIEKASMLDESA